MIDIFTTDIIFQRASLSVKVIKNVKLLLMELMENWQNLKPKLLVIDYMRNPSICLAVQAVLILVQVVMVSG